MTHHVRTPAACSQKPIDEDIEERLDSGASSQHHAKQNLERMGVVVARRIEQRRQQSLKVSVPELVGRLRGLAQNL